MHICNEGVIQDFVVEGGNEKMLLKKGQLLFQYPPMDTQKGGGGVSPLSLYDTLTTQYTNNFLSLSNSEGSIHVSSTIS